MVPGGGQFQCPWRNWSCAPSMELPKLLIHEPQNAIQVGNLQISNELPFTLFGGMNVLESRELALEVASSYKSNG